MLPWIECPSIDLDLATPPERRYQDVPAEAVEKGRRLLLAVLQEIPRDAHALADAVRGRTHGRFHAEVSSMANRFRVGWRDVMIANIAYDLALFMIGCSTVAVPTPEGPVLARNMDWWPEDILAQTSYLIRGSRNGSLEYAIAGWPGSIGVVTGLSSRGFAVALNAVCCPEGVDQTGYPVLLHIRRVLEDAADFASAVEMLSREHLAAPCLLTVVGVRNDERVVIERSPKQDALRWGESDQALIATNDYRVLFESAAQGLGRIDETTCGRYDALAEIFEDHDPRKTVADDALLRVLTRPDVIQGITAQHIIARPHAQQIRLFVPRHLV